MSSDLFQRRATRTSVGDLPSPWPDNAVSLRARIAHALELRKTDAVELELDDHNPNDPEELRFVAGARDALFGGAQDTPKQISARSLIAALGRLVRQPSSASFDHFYRLATNSSVIGVIDGFLALLTTSKLDGNMIAEIARRIAKEAPDVTAVKFAIALLGATSSRDQDLVRELGAYEELTLFSAVALSNMLPEPEMAIWEMAKSTHGWGRIQAVRRLVSPKYEEVRSWLLTDAHRNAVMAEEIAYFCATEGRLTDALKAKFPSEALLDGAGELLTALVNGGPAEDMDDYADSGEVSRLYIEHVNGRPSSDLKRFLHVRSLQSFEAENDAPWSDRERRGWTAATRWAVRTGTASFLARPDWRELAEMGLLSEARQNFWPAAEVAKALGIDTWPHHFRRQHELRSDDWYFLMQTDDEARVRQVVDLAIEQLDLARIGSGPTSTLGLGLEYADDSALDFVLQDLRHFPGIGWPLIEVGLKARTIRARNMAHKALEAWGESNWPPAARPALEAALMVEPDDKVAQKTRALLEGRPIG